jgi:hypothetical protein
VTSSKSSTHGTTPGSGSVATTDPPADWHTETPPGPATVTITQEGAIDPWKDGTVVTTRMGSSLTLPDGMVPGTTKVPDGMFYFVGNYQGAPVRVLLMEMPDNAKHEGYRQLVQAIESESQTVATGSQTVAGQPMDTVILTGKDVDDVTPLEMEVLLYSDGGRVVGLMIGTSPDHFDDLSTIRMQFFSRRFQP